MKKKGNEFKFKKEFYDIKSIKESIKDFKDVAKITLTNEGANIKVNIISKEGDISNEKMYLEFRNYVLSMMKNKIIV